MTVTVSAANSSQPKIAALVAKQAEVTAHTTAAATAGFQQATNAALLRQSQGELVFGCLDAGRLSAAAIISKFSSQFTAGWLAKYHPEIATLTTVATANTAGDAAAQLNAAQVNAVQDAIAQGLVTAASILSTMT